MDRSFLHFKLATHLWNIHRVDAYDMTLDGLREMHRWFNCPVGRMSKGLTCRFKWLRRSRPR